MEWISVDDRMPKNHCILKVKLGNGDIIKAYYHADQMSWLWFYGAKTSYFQDKQGEWLHDVTHWMDDD